MPMTKLSRRGFLGNAALLAAGTSLSGAAPAQEPSAWKMRLSTSTVQFGSLPVEEACARIAALGFEAVDIWCPFGKSTHLTQVVERLGADGLKEVLTKNKLKLHAFSVYRGGYERYAELLGKMGGGVAVRGSTKKGKASELTASMKAFIESLKPLADLAEANNSFLAIENHGGALLHTLDSFKAFVDLNDNPRLGIALAPYHLQSIKASVPEAIRTAGDQLFFFYAWQKEPGVKQLPGHGSTDFTPWLQALADIKYSRFVNPFMHHEPDPDTMSKALAESRTYLLNTHKKISKK